MRSTLAVTRRRGTGKQFRSQRPGMPRTSVGEGVTRPSELFPAAALSAENLGLILRTQRKTLGD